MARTNWRDHLGVRLAVLTLSVLLALLPASAPSLAATAEYRAQWLDGFNPGFRTPSEIATAVTNLRNANCNVMIPEVRVNKGSTYTFFFPDASFYPDLGGTIVTKGTRIACDLDSDPEQVQNPSYNALAETLSQAHDTSNGKARLDVWAWLVSFRAAGDLQANHPQWLTQNSAGTVASDFDPGHPGVEQQLVNVCLDLATNYDIDGLNFDYIRYTASNNGYNPVSVQRFNAIYGRTGLPSNTDSLWQQWRRDQVTNAVRKAYLSVLAVKPSVKMTADLICGYPGPPQPASGDPNPQQTWRNGFTSGSQAYTDDYQDWMAWMQEGILDIAIPMVYLPNCTYRDTFLQWMDFTKENQYNRQGMIGPGTYLETLDDAIGQLKETRAPSTPNGKTIAGQCLYSYYTPYASDCRGAYQHYPATMATALRTQLLPDPLHPTSPQALYPTTAPIPALPRLTNGKGHLMGTVTDLRAPSPGWVDGATISVYGPASRSIKTDGTGFYGFVDLPAGTYTVTIGAYGSLPGRSYTATITAGAVSTLNIALPLFSAADIAQALRIVGGRVKATADEDNRFDVVKTGVSANRITVHDAIRIARKVSGLEPNP